MNKTAAKRGSTTGTDQLDQYIDSVSTGAKQQFVGAAADMAWRLALTVLVPVFIGVKLDDHFHTSPSYVLTALFVAAGASSVVIWKTIQSVNQATTKKGTKTK